MKTYISSKLALFSCAATGIAAYGVAFAVLGAAFGATNIRTRVHATLPEQGMIFLLLYLGVLASNLMIGGLVIRFGRKTILLVTNALVIATLIWFSVLHSLLTAEVAAFFLGWGGGGVNVSVNALVSDIYPARRAPMLNLLGVFFGLGALCTPLLSIAASSITISKFFMFATLLPVVAFTLTGLLSFPPVVNHLVPRSLRNVLGENASAVRPIAGILFFENGNEAVFAAWMSTIALARGFDRRTATLVLTTYWLLLMLGRLAAARFGSRRKRARTVSACAVGSILGGFILLIAPNVISMIVGALLVGVASAPIFKTTLSMAGDLCPDAAAKLYGPLFALSLVAATGAPWVAGRVAQTFSLSMVLLLPILGGLSILVLSFRLPQESTSFALAVDLGEELCVGAEYLPPKND
jgi:FHS family glucose/mannose:H+ symporter-like MFS transporter